LAVYQSPHQCSEAENLVAVGRSVRAGGALKIANLEKVRMFGAT